MKVTIAFSDELLYRQIKVRAAASGRQIREVVEEALEAWLDAQDNAEDRAGSQAALVEYAASGGVEAGAFFDRMISEGRVAYDAE